MNIPQLLDAFRFGPHIEIIISSLPQRPSLRIAQLPRDILLEHLQRKRKLRAFRLGDQQVNMLRHDHIPSHLDPVPLSNPLKSLLKDIAGSRSTRTGCATVAAKRDKVQTARFLKSLKTPRHEFNRMPESGTTLGIETHLFCTFR